MREASSVAGNAGRLIIPSLSSPSSMTHSNDPLCAFCHVKRERREIEEDGRRESTQLSRRQRRDSLFNDGMQSGEGNHFRSCGASDE